MAANASSQVFSSDPGGGTATDDTIDYHQVDTPSNQGPSIQRIGTPTKGCHMSHPRNCGQSSRVYCRIKLRPLLQEEAVKNQQKSNANQPLASSSMGHDRSCCTTINYVLCSPHFEDVAIINPINIDDCDINVGYTVPSRNKIRNSYFKQLKCTCKTVIT